MYFGAKLFYLLIVTAIIFVSFVSSFAGTEEVYVIDIIDNDDEIQIRRNNGSIYLIEVGLGCRSLWRYENKTILISSPGIFLGFGARVILPDAGQDCKIWDSNLVINSPSLEPENNPAGNNRIKPRCESGHWISSVSDNGEIIILEDRSVWEVDAIDTLYTTLWLTIENITLCGDRMINTDNGESVTVRQLR